LRPVSNKERVKIIQDVFIEKYPQAAIDKFTRVVTQVFSKVPEEKEEGFVSEIIISRDEFLFKNVFCLNF